MFRTATLLLLRTGIVLADIVAVHPRFHESESPPYSNLVLSPGVRIPRLRNSKPEPLNLNLGLVDALKDTNALESLSGLTSTF